MRPLCQVIHVAVKHTEVMSRRSMRPRDMRYALVRIGDSLTSVHIDERTFDACAKEVPVVPYADHRSAIDAGRRG